MVLLPLRLCRGIHGGVLAPAQAVDLVAQEGRMLKFQQLGSFLHLPGQAVNGGFALELAIRRVFILAFSALSLISIESGMALTMVFGTMPCSAL